MKVFYFSYQPYFIKMAELLKKDLGWEPIYWVVVQDTKKVISKKFPNAICHDHFEATKGNPPTIFKDIKLPILCPSFISKHHEAEHIVLQMLERNDAHTDTLSYQARRELFIYFLKYWKYVLENLRPDYVVFEEEPHQANDYILYLMCKELNIKTIMFIQTIFYPQMFPVFEFEKGSEIIKSRYLKNLEEKKEINERLSKRMGAYFHKITGNYENAIKLHLFHQENEVKRLLYSDFSKRFSIEKLRAIRTIFLNLISIKNFMYRFKLIFKPEYFSSDQKERGKSFQKSKMGYFTYQYYRLITIRKKEKLRGYYESLVTSVTPENEDFIFVALNYQPEKTTSPLGGVFVDQLLMVETLSAATPAEWKIFVKDHPSQFVSSYARYGEKARSKKFYKKLANIPKVKIISLQDEPFQYIDNAIAVATVTGTVAWEAVVRGVPALIFGHPWFKNCEGVFYTPNIKAVGDVIKKLQKGYSVDLSSVKTFADVVEKESFDAVIGGTRAGQYFNISETQNAKSHASAIKRLLNYK